MDAVSIFALVGGGALAVSPFWVAGMAWQRARHIRAMSKMVADRIAYRTEADELIVGLETNLAAEKVENAHLVKDVAYLNDRLRPFIMPRARDAKGHFLKVAA